MHENSFFNKLNLNNNKQNTRGITLIALVITIIVLLILAGVSIAMLTGENGILTQTQSAKSLTDKSSDVEKIKLAIIGARLNSQSDSLDIQDIKEQLFENFNDTIIYEETENYPINITVNSKNYSIYKNGVVLPKRQLTAESIDGTDNVNIKDIYGSYVSNYKSDSLETSNLSWKIFYSNGSNIFLISDDYIERSDLPYSTNTSGDFTNNKPNDGLLAKSAFFTNIFSDYTGSDRISSNLKSLNRNYFFNTDGSYKFPSQNSNIKAISYMLDTLAWNSRFMNSNYAEYTIGGPSIEMFFNSYNKKYASNYNATNVNATGYIIDNINEGELQGDSLYVLSDSSSANSYWLSSPSADGVDRILTIYYKGRVGIGSTYYDSIGFRPIVCLKSGLILQKNADNNSYSIL